MNVVPGEVKSPEENENLQEMKNDADAYEEEVVQEPVEEKHITETHIILHLYTTNGGTINNFDLINPTDELTDLISQEMDKIHKYSLTKQSLQEAFGEASGTWSDIKQLLDNYVKDNTPKSFATKVSEIAGKRVEHANKGVQYLRSKLPNINFFGNQPARNQTAKVHPEVTTGGSRKLKTKRKTRKINTK